MEKYDYLTSITMDIVDWMKRNDFDLNLYEDETEAFEALHDELWPLDSITGNGTHFYSTEEECDDFLYKNINLVIEACGVFAIGICELDRAREKGILSRRLDSVIRCRLLGRAITEAISIWREENYG